MGEKEEIEGREKEKALLKADNTPSIIIETKMIKGVLQSLNFS